MIINKISKIYRMKNKEEVKAVNNISIDLDEKGLIFVVGPSGSGKTTLLNLIGGLDRPDHGEIILNGEDIAKYNDNELNDYRGEKIGFIFQEYNVINHLTVYENIVLSQSVLGKITNDNELDKLMASLGILELKNRRVDEISGGQRQRVAIARALLKNSKIILADEPTGALDEETSVELMNYIKMVSKLSMVIVVSHDKKLANKYADRIIELSNGIIVNDIILKRKLNNKSNKENLALMESTKKTKRIKNNTLIRIGIKGLFKNKVRLVSFLVAIILSLSMLTIIVSSTRFDENKVFVQSMYDSDNKLLFSSVDENEYSTVESKQIGEFANFNSVLSSTIYNYNIFDCYYSYGSFNGILEINNETADILGLELLYGNFPTNQNEILITEYQYSYFFQGGYVNYISGEINVVNEYDDIVGSKIGSIDLFKHNGGFIITGIIDTKCDTSQFEQLKEYQSFVNTSDEIIDLYNLYVAYLSNSPHTILYGSPGSIKKIKDSINYSDFNQYISYRSDIQLYNSLNEAGGIYVPLEVISKSDSIINKKNSLDGLDIILKYPFEIYWKEEVEIPNLQNNEIVVSLDYLLNFTLNGNDYRLKTHYNNKINEEIQSFVDANYASIENLFQADYLNASKSDYFEYIFSLNIGEENKYHPGMDQDYFTCLAQKYLVSLCFSDAFPNLKLSTGLRGFDDYVEIVGIYTLRENETYTFIDTTYVSDDLYNIIAPNNQEIIAFSVSGNYFDDVNMLRETATFDDSLSTSISFSNYIVDDINQSISIILGVDSILRYVLVLFSIITILLLISHFSNDVAEDKRMLIIFRSLGVKNSDIISIYVVRSFSLFLITTCLSSVGSYFIINYINKYLISLYHFMFNPIIFDSSVILIIAVICIITILLSTVIPIRYVNKERLGKVL